VTRHHRLFSNVEDFLLCPAFTNLILAPNRKFEGALSTMVRHRRQLVTLRRTARRSGVFVLVAKD
jgi:hypothetical protein